MSAKQYRTKRIKFKMKALLFWHMNIFVLTYFLHLKLRTMSYSSYMFLMPDIVLRTEQEDKKSIERMSE